MMYQYQHVPHSTCGLCFEGNMTVSNKKFKDSTIMHMCLEQHEGVQAHVYDTQPCCKAQGATKPVITGKGMYGARCEYHR